MILYTLSNKKKFSKIKNIMLVKQNKNYNKKLLNNNTIHLAYNTLKIKNNIHNSLYNAYIGKKNNTFILNIKNIQTYFIKALKIFLYIYKKKGKILIVNTNPELSKYTYNLKKKTMYKNINFIDVYYTKGNLTNYKKIFFNIKTFVSFFSFYNEFLNYNKIYFAKYKKMKNNYKGFIHYLYNYKKKNFLHKYMQKNYIDKNWKPDLIILLSTINVNCIVNEANTLNIPIIGFVEKNAYINKITYPIPNNIYYYTYIHFFFKIFYKIVSKYNNN